MPTAPTYLTPRTLLRDFGPRTAVTCDGVRLLCEAATSTPREMLSPWRTHFNQWTGRAIQKAAKDLTKLANRLGVTSDADALLLAMQTYYALLVEQVADRVLPGGPSQLDGSELLPGSPFAWYKTVDSEHIRNLIDRLAGMLADYRLADVTTADDDGGDLFKPLYQDLFPRSLRHALGEYYTPDWLARHVLDQVGYQGVSDQRLLDPSCGSGTFLVMAIRRMRATKSPFAPRKQRHLRGAKGDQPELETPFCDPAAGNASIHPSSFITHHFPIVGFDLNPLAVLTARTNYLAAVADLLPETGPVKVPVYLCDSIVGDSLPPCAATPFDFVVGNPPWIAWDNLSDADRQATKPLWERYGLFSLSGNAARHGGGKKDLSMLMLYATADRHLKPGGRLGMVITQTIFQSKDAGDGFRRFRLGPDGEPLRVLRVDDMTELRPFDAANWTSTIVLQKGEPTEYPVKYVRWKAEDTKCGSATQDQCVARPIDPARPNTPWLVLPDTKTSACLLAVPHRQSTSTNDSSSSTIHPSSFIIHPSHYTAHLGANSGGANGVYWLELLDQTDEGVRVRNLTGRGKRPIESVEHTLEPDLLYPLLRWSDVRRWSAVPRAHILLAQEPTSRSGIAEETMRNRYPRTLAYLERFRDFLAVRAAYRRYQERGPFYSMYNVGPYTVAPVKVVWRRMDRQINAAVLETIHDPQLGHRPIVPQETCVIVACNSADEAHYLCAMLNSRIVGDLVSSSSVRGGKGFGTPGMLDFIPLAQYRPDDPRHIELAALSRAAHSLDSQNLQGDIDHLAADVLGNAVARLP